MSEPVLRGGIIGCGFFSQFHLEAWARMDGAEIVAASDLDLSRARAAAPKAYSDPAEMLDHERLDFVDIVTRPDTHPPLVRLVAERKLAIICQKPMAPTWREGVEMAETAERADVRLMIHENWRWQSWFRALDAMLRRGDIGEPLGYRFRVRKRDGFGANAYPAQPYFREMPRLLIHETLVHHLDTARFLFGDIASVYAETRRINPVIAGEDCATILVRHARGTGGVVDGHRFLDCVPNGDAMGEAAFEGTEGVLTVLATGDIVRDGEVIRKNEITRGYKGDSVFATQRHFIDCLRSGAPFESGAREYLGTFAAVEAAYRSVAGKRAVRIDELLSAVQNAPG